MSLRTSALCRCLVVSIFCLLTLARPLVSEGASKEGEPLPAMSLADVESGAVKEVGALLKGAVGAVVYMQTSCAACRKEMTALKDLQLKFPQFKVVVISVDSGSPERVARYKEHFAFEFPFFHDPEFKTPELYGFSFTPALILVAKDGNIALLKGGYRPGDEVELEKKIAALVGK